MKCTHCNEELGDGDAYDLMMSHRFSCDSKVARRLVKSEEEDE